MAITENRIAAIEARLTRLEEVSNDIVVAIDQFVDMGTVNQLLTVVQQLIDDLSSRVEALEARVTSIEEEPLT